MIWKKYKHACLAFGAALIFSITIWLLGTNGYFLENNNLAIPEITVVSQLVEDDFIINANTYIYEEKSYFLCNNVEVNLIDISDYIGLSLANLMQAEYPSAEGWQIDILSEDTVVIYQGINGFCSKHADKRHLTAKDGYVVIMYGPRGTNGGIAQVTGILVDLLPELLKGQIEAGLLEFDDHEQALQALDSFDEYY